MDIMITGYAPHQNAAFDEMLDSLKFDADILGVPTYSDENVSRVFASVGDLLDKDDRRSWASLAIIGMTQHFIKMQVSFNDNMLISFSKACAKDPLAAFEERASQIAILKKQLSSYVDDSWR